MGKPNIKTKTILPCERLETEASLEIIERLIRQFFGASVSNWTERKPTLQVLLRISKDVDSQEVNQGFPELWHHLVYTNFGNHRLNVYTDLDHPKGKKIESAELQFADQKNHLEKSTRIQMTSYVRKLVCSPDFYQAAASPLRAPAT